MPWAKLDDGLYDHPKLDSLGAHRLAGVGLWVLSISWSCRYLTDGFIPTDRISRLGGTVDLADELVRVGLYERCDGGYRIHDWADYQPTRDTVLRKRAQTSAAGKIGGRRRWALSGDPASNTSGELLDNPLDASFPEALDASFNDPLNEPPNDTLDYARAFPSRPVPSRPGTLRGDARAREGDPTDEERELATASNEDVARQEDEEPEAAAVTWLARHGCYLRPDSGYYRHLVRAIEEHGGPAVLAMFERLAELGLKDGDTKGFVFGAIDGLNAPSRPSGAELREAEPVAPSKGFARTAARLADPSTPEGQLRAALLAKEQAEAESAPAARP